MISLIVIVKPTWNTQVRQLKQNYVWVTRLSMDGQHNDNKRLLQLAITETKLATKFKWHPLLVVILSWRKLSPIIASFDILRHLFKVFVPKILNWNLQYIFFLTEFWKSYPEFLHPTCRLHKRRRNKFLLKLEFLRDQKIVFETN